MRNAKYNHYMRKEGMKGMERGNIITYYKSYPTTTARLSWCEIEGIYNIKDRGKYVIVIIIN